MGEEEIRLVKPKCFILDTKGIGKISISFSELTFKCPITGYPDFGTIYFSYIPDKKILELKSFKLWINSFRDEYIGYEKLFIRIWQELWELLNPKSMVLKVVFNPRGNVSTIIEWEEKQNIK